GAGDAQGDVQLGGDGLAGLSDLEAVGVEAGVGGGAGGADGAAEQVGELFDDGEVLGRADTAAAGDDDGGLGQFGPGALGLGDPVGDGGQLVGVGEADLDVGDGRGDRRRRGRDRGGPYGDQRDTPGDLRLDGDRSGEDGL